MFTIDCSQAMYLPADARLPEGVTEVQMRVHGLARTTSPVGHAWTSSAGTATASRHAPVWLVVLKRASRFLTQRG